MVQFCKVVCGSNFSLGLSTKGELYFWGNNLITYPNQNISSIPTKLNTAFKVTDIAAGHTEYAVMAANSDVYITGWKWSTVKDDYEAYTTVLTMPDKSVTIVDLQLVSSLVLCRTSDGQVWEWERLRTTDVTRKHQFRMVHNIPKASAVASSFFNSALTIHSEIWVWSMGYSSQAFQLTFDEKVKGIVSGRACILALDSQGTVFYIGDDARTDKLAHNQANAFSATRQSSLPSLETLYIGQSSGHYFGLDSEDNMWGWGRNEYGQLGIGEFSQQNRVIQPTRIIQPFGRPDLISLGTAHSLAIDKEGQVWAWGLNNNGQLGLGDQNSLNEPTRIVVK